MKEHILSFLSLCRKAGKLKWGFDSVEKTLESTCLLVFAGDVSEKTMERMLKKAKVFNVQAVKLPFTTEDIHIYVGKSAAVLSILDEGFAKAFLKRLEESEVSFLSVSTQ